MDVPPSADDDRRCPQCGALVTEDARWCGQCFCVLTESAPARSDVPSMSDGPRRGAPAVGVKAPTWPCPACGHDNAIEVDVCSICGTAFATLMRQDERRPQVEPKDALAWSLVFPGLGHHKVGRGLDGVARGVLFGMLFSMAVLTGLSGVTSGMVFGLFALFMALALVVYAGSAYEAFRLAEGGEPLVQARTLLWATVGVIMLSVVVLALTVVTATKR